ncbi:MAG: GNAT family N-acetyltransferase [Actinomycetota bacterium]|nr:GNAT family N-acetyltransferase [Actinomycetota bacterium]
MSSTTTGGPATASPHPRIYGKSVRPNPGWPSTEVIQTARLTLEPLRVEHADEMAPLLNDPALHSYIGGQPATLEQLRRRYTRQAVGRSVDGAQGWLNWIARHRATAAAVGTVQATLQHQSAATSAEITWVVAGARAPRRAGRGHQRSPDLRLGVVHPFQRPRRQHLVGAAATRTRPRYDLNLPSSADTLLPSTVEPQARHAPRRRSQ